ncbi:MAG: hypothetical protein RL585_2483 [Pseudomonadota bacterium]
MRRIKTIVRSIATAISLSIASASALAQQTIQVAYIDPLSGGGASIGEHGLKHFRYIADQLNTAGGVLGRKFEIVPFDGKTNPQESIVQAQKAIDQYCSSAKSHRPRDSNHHAGQRIIGCCSTF